MSDGGILNAWRDGDRPVSLIPVVWRVYFYGDPVNQEVT